ncbi:MAG: sugar ABC transporter permease [Clostridia bacterium]|nr:sugar ABC transporter permease [Clostridia bacterium]
MTREKREAAHGLALITPIMISFTVFTVVPLAMLFWYSFRNYNILKNTDVWNGFTNYVRIFTRKEYLSSLGTTILMAVILTAVSVSVSFLVGLGCTKVRKHQGLLRTIWYIPSIIPIYVITAILNNMLANDGTINKILALFGAEGVKWYRSTFWMYFWIIFITSWRGIGGTSLLFIAALGSVDKNVYEAADLDGATGIKRIWYITIPLIKPMFSFILINAFIGACQIFEPVLFISEGGPDQSTKVILYRIYDEAFLNGKMGFACAMSVVVTIFIMIFSIAGMIISDSDMLKIKE